MEHPEIPEHLLHEFILWAHLAANKGLLNCSSGNLSHRFENDCMLISQTGSWLENIETEQISKIKINNGQSHNNVEPSGEWRLHSSVYRHRPDAKVVLHFQSPYATTIACSKDIPNYNAIIEVPVYIGVVAHVPYLLPGSKQLAEAVAEAAGKSCMIQMANHGQVVLGKSYKEVIEKAIFFELCCKIIIEAGNKYSPIQSRELPQLLNYRG